MFLFGGKKYDTKQFTQEAEEKRIVAASVHPLHALLTANRLGRRMMPDPILDEMLRTVEDLSIDIAGDRGDEREKKEHGIGPVLTGTFALVAANDERFGPSIVRLWPLKSPGNGSVSISIVVELTNAQQELPPNTILLYDHDIRAEGSTLPLHRADGRLITDLKEVLDVRTLHLQPTGEPRKFVLQQLAETDRRILRMDGGTEMYAPLEAEMGLIERGLIYLDSDRWRTTHIHREREAFPIMEVE